MCRYMTRLAEIDPHHYIMCCEHGSIHMQWEKVRFTFTYSEFVHLIAVLEARQYDVPAHIHDVQEWDNWLHNQQFRVNVGAISLTLTSDDLAVVIRAAYAALERLGPDCNPAEYAIRTHQLRMTVPPSKQKKLFSAN